MPINWSQNRWRNLSLEEHRKRCYKQLNTNSVIFLPDKNESQQFYWNVVPGTIFQGNLDKVYEKIVYWSKNVFICHLKLVPRNVSMKFLVLWIYGLKLHPIALKAIYIMMSLPLQKPSRSSKAKNNLKVLEKRLNL